MRIRWPDFEVAADAGAVNGIPGHARVGAIERGRILIRAAADRRRVDDESEPK